MPTLPLASVPKLSISIFNTLPINKSLIDRSLIDIYNILCRDVKFYISTVDKLFSCFLLIA